MLETLTETENVESKETKQDGLPVFNDKNYVENLRKLLSCREIENSFDIQKHSPTYDLFVRAQDYLEELETELQEIEAVFLTQDKSLG